MPLTIRIAPTPWWRAARRCWVIPLLALLALLATLPAGADDQEAQRARFLQAEAALERGDRAAFEAHRAALADYPLYPYLVFADLRTRLSMAAPEEIAAFLKSYADTPLPLQLRRAWLATLAREQRWETYVAFYEPDGDLQRQCWRRQALLATGERERALADMPTLWLHGASLPDACDPLLAIWHADGGISPELAWERIALAMEAGNPRLARYLRVYLPDDQQRWVHAWYELYHHPGRLARAPLDPANPRSRQIAAHTLLRLARREPQQAAQLEPALSARFGFSSEQRALIARRIGLSLAASGDPAASLWLGRVPPGYEDEHVQLWRVRVALLRQDWAQVLQALGRLPEAHQQEARWRYWRARAWESLGDTERALALYREVAQSRSYEGFLAADRLGLPHALQERPLVPDPKRLRRLAASPALQRARELLALDRLLEARREWHAATRRMDEVELRAAARLAYEWGWHDRAILALAEAEYWDDLDLRFPLAHGEAVVDHARRAGIDAAWAFAVIRRESAFDRQARSPRGALGLMQVMPRTARQLARELHRHPRRPDLFHPETNIALGTMYLRQVLDRFAEHPVLATAAYNAGPFRVSGWLPEDRALPSDVWIETVPFGETRDYVRNVLAYTAIYEQRMGGDERPLRERMPPVPPRESAHGQQAHAEAR